MRFLARLPADLHFWLKIEAALTRGQAMNGIVVRALQAERERVEAARNPPTPTPSSSRPTSAPSPEEGGAGSRDEAGSSRALHAPGRLVRQLVAEYALPELDCPHLAVFRDGAACTNCNTVAWEQNAFGDWVVIT